MGKRIQEPPSSHLVLLADVHEVLLRQPRELPGQNGSGESGLPGHVMACGGMRSRVRSSHLKDGLLF